MAVLADNNVYLTINGEQVQAYFIEVTFDATNEAQDTTSGANVTHMMRAPGLNDTTGEIRLAYDAATVDDYIQDIQRGATVTMTYGPEGQTSGKPRHEQSIIITSVSHGRNVDKSMTEFSISWEGAAAPTYDMHAGAVWS